jgi:hypothetical protein
VLACVHTPCAAVQASHVRGARDQGRRLGHCPLQVSDCSSSSLHPPAPFAHPSQFSLRFTCPELAFSASACTRTRSWGPLPQAPPKSSSQVCWPTRVASSPLPLSSLQSLSLRGWFTDGTMFDSSYPRGLTLQFNQGSSQVNPEGRMLVRSHISLNHDCDCHPFSLLVLPFPARIPSPSHSLFSLIPSSGGEGVGYGAARGMRRREEDTHSRECDGGNGAGVKRGEEGWLRD